MFSRAKVVGQSELYVNIIYYPFMADSYIRQKLNIDFTGWGGGVSGENNAESRDTIYIVQLSPSNQVYL